MLDAESRAAFSRNVAEMASADVLVKQVGLPVRELRIVELHIVGDVPFGDEDIQMAVIIEVE